MKSPPFRQLVVLSILCISACSGNKDSAETSLPSQTLMPGIPPTTEVRPAPPIKPPEETLIVIEQGAEESASKGLVEASRAERARRAQSGTPEIVLTDKNLEEYQKGAQLTFVHEDESQQPPQEDGTAEASGASTDSDGLPASEVGEQYWRDRGRQIRTDWRESIDRIEELQGDVAEYRRRFYEEDDPSIRDTRIKPAWDRALEELEEARDDARTFEEDLGNYLDLGHQAGAYQEWLSEGVELEPDPDELERLEEERNTIQFDEPDIAPEEYEIDEVDPR